MFADQQCILRCEESAAATHLLAKAVVEPTTGKPQVWHIRFPIKSRHAYAAMGTQKCCFIWLWNAQTQELFLITVWFQLENR